MKPLQSLPFSRDTGMQQRCGGPSVGPVAGQIFFLEGIDVYLDVTAVISSCKSAHRDKYGKSRLATEEHLQKSLELHDDRVREVVRRWKDGFQPLLPTATVEKEVFMDLELLDDHQKRPREITTVYCKCKKYKGDHEADL